MRPVHIFQRSNIVLPRQAEAPRDVTGDTTANRQVGADEAEGSDVHRDSGGTVVGVLDLEAGTDGVSAEDRLSERWELVERSHPSAAASGIDAARDGTDV